MMNRILCLHSTAFRRSGAVFFALLLLLAFHALFNLWWLAADNHPIFGDEDVHMGNTRTYWKTCVGYQGPDRWADRLVALTKIETRYPPLLYLLGTGFITLFGRSPDALAFAMTFHFAFLLLGTYLLSATFLNRRQAVFAAVVTGFAPILFGASRYYSLDMLATAFVVWVLFALVKTEGYQRTRWVVLFAVFAGLGLSVKPNTLFFWIIPWTWVVGRAFGALLAWDSRPKVNLRGLLALIRNLVLSGLIIAAISVPWYLLHFEYLRDFWTTTEHPTGGVFCWPDSSVPWLAYPFLVINLGVFLPTFCLALAGGAVALAGRRYRRGPATLIVIWLVGSYAVMTLFVAEKEVRYIMPVVPALTILAALAISAVPLRGWRLAGGALCSVLLVVQYVGLSVNCYPRTTYDLDAHVHRIELPLLTYDRTDPHVYFRGSRKLSLYRNALVSASYSYFPPYRGDSFLDRSVRAMVKDLNVRPTSHKECATLYTLDEYFSGIFGLGGHCRFYDPPPNPFAISQWRDEPLAFKRLVYAGDFKVHQPEDLPEEIFRGDFVLCKFRVDDETNARKRVWKDCFAAHGFKVIDEFYDPGYGICWRGDFLVLAASGRRLGNTGA